MTNSMPCELVDVGPEESVLGSILSAASYSVDAGHKVCDRVLATGLLPEHFWRVSNGGLFGAIVAQRLAGLPLDPISMANALDGDTASASTRGRLHTMAHIVTCFGSAAHHANLILIDARKRQAG